MNIYDPELDRKPGRDEAEAALAVLKRWADRASEADIVALDPAVGALLGAGYPVLNRAYPDAFLVDEVYKDSLPDLQNGPSSLIVGAKQVIQHVGISNFRLPIRYRTRDAGEVMLETSVTGTVSLEAEKKGINMSRIMRSFYAHAERDFSFQVIEHALEDYKRDLGSFDARIQMRFSFPVKVGSLRSGLSGWQYYDIALELVDTAGLRKQIIHLDFVYSSTCPCSLELSEHARRTRGQLAEHPGSGRNQHITQDTIGVLPRCTKLPHPDPSPHDRSPVLHRRAPRPLHRRRARHHRRRPAGRARPHGVLSHLGRATARCRHAGRDRAHRHIRPAANRGDSFGCFPKM